MPSVHDRGGWPGAGAIDTSEHQYSIWEKRTDAMMSLVMRQGRVFRVDEMRRAIESIPPERYESMTYYERWLAALESLLVEKGLLEAGEVDRKLAERGGHGSA